MKNRNLHASLHQLIFTYITATYNEAGLDLWEKERKSVLSFVQFKNKAYNYLF